MGSRWRPSTRHIGPARSACPSAALPSHRPPCHGCLASNEPDAPDICATLGPSHVGASGVAHSRSPHLSVSGCSPELGEKRLRLEAMPKLPAGAEYHDPPLL